MYASQCDIMISILRWLLQDPLVVASGSPGQRPGPHGPSVFDPCTGWKGVGGAPFAGSFRLRTVAVSVLRYRRFDTILRFGGFPLQGRQAGAGRARSVWRRREACAAFHRVSMGQRQNTPKSEGMIDEFGKLGDVTVRRSTIYFIRLICWRARKTILSPALISPDTVHKRKATLSGSTRRALQNVSSPNPCCSA